MPRYVLIGGPMITLVQIVDSIWLIPTAFPICRRLAIRNVHVEDPLQQVVVVVTCRPLTHLHACVAPMSRQSQAPLL